MKNVRNEIDEYLALWDQAQSQFPKAKKAAAPKNNSYFGMQSIPEVNDFSEDEEEHWRDVYYRSLEIDPDEINGSGEQILSEDDINQQYLAGMMDIHEVREAKKKAAESKEKKAVAAAKKKAAPAKKKSKKTQDVRKPLDDDAPDFDDEVDGFGHQLAKKLGDADFKVNPVHFASVGDDSALRVTPNWTDGKELRALDKMKRLLHDLESEWLGQDVRGGDPEPIRVKIIALRRQCEALSQSLIPDPRKDVS